MAERLIVTDQGLGVVEVHCVGCRGYVTRFTTNMPEAVAEFKRVVPWWDPARLSHQCAVAGVEGPGRAGEEWWRLGGAAAWWAGEWPQERQEAPIQARPMVARPEGDGVLWYSAQQKAEWAAQGKAPAYGRLTDGRVVEYTELCTGAHRDTRSVYADAECLGAGVFDHVGDAPC